MVVGCTTFTVLAATPKALLMSTPLLATPPLSCTVVSVITRLPWVGITAKSL